MKIKFNVKRELKITAAVLVVVMGIAFTEHKNTDVVIKDVTVRIDNIHNNHFLEESDIMSLTQLNIQNVRGASTSKIKLKEIEKKIKKDPFVKNAEMYTDLKGNLIVRVELRRPVARIVRNDGPDGYIAEDGTIMPVSDKFTARVILISGSYMRKLLQMGNLNKTPEGKDLLSLITSIRNDEFWNALLTQMDMDNKGRITMIPQVGEERIEFGTADNQQVKLKKLKIFYSDILPRVGWNKYHRVNLEYHGQLVAE